MSKFKQKHHAHSYPVISNPKSLNQYVLCLASCMPLLPLSAISHAILIFANLLAKLQNHYHHLLIKFSLLPHLINYSLNI